MRPKGFAQLTGQSSQQDTWVLLALASVNMSMLPVQNQYCNNSPQTHPHCVQFRCCWSWCTFGNDCAEVWLERPLHHPHRGRRHQSDTACTHGQPSELHPKGSRWKDCMSMSYSCPPGPPLPSCIPSNEMAASRLLSSSAACPLFLP